MSGQGAPRSLGIGLLGFGTVGQALVRLLKKEGPRLLTEQGIDLRLVAVGTRNLPGKDTSWVGPGIRFTEDLAGIAGDPGLDVVAELIGGLEPAGSLVRQALTGGKSVVTANKLLLARQGPELEALARAKGVGLGMEASVAGGIPVVRAIRESLCSDRLVEIAGILNGTCNFILTGMEHSGRPYPAMLADAQKLGYAEADPRSDVDGEDAAYKLTLLARMAFGQAVAVEEVPREGIGGLMPCDFVYARQLGRTPRQIALAHRLPSGRLILSVRTHMVSSTSMLAKVEGPFNAVRVKGEIGGEFVFTGRGAGGDPTAVAVLSDILELARSGGGEEISPPGFARLSPSAPAGPEEFVAPFYLRFVVRDRPGIIAEISRCLADHAINIDAVFQAPWADKEALPFVITLEPVSQKELSSAVGKISRLDFHRAPPLALPMTE